jgi:hypothetical protein
MQRNEKPKYNGRAAVERACYEWMHLLSSEPPRADYESDNAHVRARFYRFALLHEYLGLEGAAELRALGDFLTGDRRRMAGWLSLHALDPSRG